MCKLTRSWVAQASEPEELASYLKVTQTSDVARGCHCEQDPRLQQYVRGSELEAELLG